MGNYFCVKKIRGKPHKNYQRKRPFIFRNPTLKSNGSDIIIKIIIMGHHHTVSASLDIGVKPLDKTAIPIYPPVPSHPIYFGNVLCFRLEWCEAWLSLFQFTQQKKIGKKWRWTKVIDKNFGQLVCSKLPLYITSNFFVLNNNEKILLQKGEKILHLRRIFYV